MKKILFALFFVSTFFTTTASAQTGTATGTPEPFVVDFATTTPMAAPLSTTNTAPGNDPFFLNFIQQQIPLGDAHPITVITSIIRVLLNFLSIVFLIMILSAGVKWMFSGGDEEKTKAAKRTLLNAIIGVIIILVSQALVRFVFSAVTTIPASGAPSKTSNF